MTAAIPIQPTRIVMPPSSAIDRRRGRSRERFSRKPAITAITTTASELAACKSRAIDVVRMLASDGPQTSPTMR